MSDTVIVWSEIKMEQRNKQEYYYLLLAEAGYNLEREIIQRGGTSYSNNNITLLMV